MAAVVTAHGTALDQAQRLSWALCQEGAGSELSGFAACLTALLSALNWRGDPRRLAEALPHFAAELDLTDLRNVLAQLGYPTKGLRVPLGRLDERLFPCLYVGDRGETFVALGRHRDRLSLFDPTSGGEREMATPSTPGTAYVIAPAAAKREQRTQANWFADTMRRFRSVAVQTMVLTALMNGLTIAVPLAIMAIYDQVVGKSSPVTLVYIGLGVALALGLEFALRALRARVQAHVGARLEYIVGCQTFRHLLYLPPVFTERAPVGAQVARLKEFESLRDFFTSPLAAVFMDLPFVLLFLIVIAAIAGPLALIPIVLIAVYAVIGLAVFPPMRRAVKAASGWRSERYGFLVEATARMRAVKQFGAEKVWAERFRELSAGAATANFRAAVLAAAIENLSHVIMVAAGAATVILGVGRIIDGAMTVGALIATMALVWRVLSPLQTGFNMLGRLEQIRLSVQQLNQVHRFRPERELGLPQLEKKVFSGQVSFHRVSLRYTAEGDPALLNVSLGVKAGELVAIVGPSGSGKSTLLKAALGLYQPQAGAISIDGIDIRQLDPIELRENIAYVPQHDQEFYGTVGQNLRLASPTASQGEVVRACGLAGLLPNIEDLPKGFETRMGDQTAARFPAGFHRQLALARAYLRRAPILLLAEPASGLDDDGDEALKAALTNLRGKRTILLITHRPSHMRLADRVVVFEGARAIMQGPPDEVLPKFNNGLF